MPKIVWLNENKVKEKPIPERGFLTIGRSTSNNIVLSGPQVSEQHARLLCGPHGCLIKDLDSADGVQVNGEPVHSRFLKGGDIIRIGHHLLEYLVAEKKQPPSAVSTDGTAIPSQRLDTGGKPDSGSALTPFPQRAYLRFVSGPEAGHIQNIDRPLVSIGDPEGYYAAISHRTNSYCLLNLGKGLRVKLNDEPVHGAAAMLENGDLITLGEHRIEVRIFHQKQKARD
jgi:predicted component of type VI protein secretion system